MEKQNVLLKKMNFHDQPVFGWLIGPSDIGSADMNRFSLF